MAGRRRIACWGIPLLLAAAGVFLAWPADDGSRDAPASRRTIEARLPGLPFGPCPLVGGGIGLRAACPRPTGAESGELTLAGHRLRGTASEAAGSASRSQRLNALLAASSAADFSRSLGRLARHASQAENSGGPATAEALTDLAAAYLLRAEVLGDASDLLSAAEAARAALEQAPEDRSALFDLALAYERLLLRRAAAAAWSRLLELETDGGWASEAQAHLARLTSGESAPAPPADLESAREAALDDLLPRWAASAASVDAAAALDAELLELARRSAAGGDRWLAEIHRAASTAGDRGDRAALAAPLRELAARRRAKEGGEALACAPGLDRLEGAFRRAASPLALAALHLTASCAYGEQDFARADALAARWQAEALAGGFAASAGRAAWMRGTTASAGGSFAIAEGFYREAIGHFELAGEPRNAAMLRLMIANGRARAGDPAGAWRQLHAALAEILAGGDARQISMANQEAAWQLGLAGRPELGLLYGEETLAEDLAGPEAAARCDARFLRGWLLQRSGRRTEAEKELGLLRAGIAALEDESARKPFELLALSAEAELHLGSDPRRSERAAAAALVAYQDVAFDLSPLDLHLVLARARRRLGEDAAALAALEDGMIYFAAQARENPEISFKVRLFDRAGKILEEKMELELEQGNNAAAFASLEASRAHLLLDELGAESVGLAAIQQALEKDDLLVQYVFLGDRILAFRVDRESFSLIELEGVRRQLESSVAAWWTASRAQEKILAEELYDHLLRPLAAPGERLLISVPDALAELPWAALRDRESGRRAIEDHQILIVPSASAMLAIERRGWSRASLAAAPTLAVGDPAFDPRIAPDLAPDLPGAREEARAAAAAFPALLLEREQATGSAFLAAMAARPLVLYAGHAVAESREPLATRLFFAPDDSFPTGELAARDFYRRTLPNGALVILSGCETGGGYGSPIEGRLDLAHPFLASGAAQVILTRRTVFDLPAQKFLRLFFDALRAGGDPWEAFRAAQIASIAAGDEAGQTHHRESPTWAIYQLVGGRWFSPGGGAS